ncbi:MAG: beta-ketoacyl synthase N-terminal-like domain-containing protein, partial [Hyphomicrobiaceae bacterium]
MSSIAIVGMACRFPGAADNLDNYWNLLKRGDCAIGEIPEERWSLEGFYDPRPDIPTRSYSKWGGFLDDVRSFDPGFFGLSPREAEAMDPQQRLLLEVAYEAVQNAGVTLAELRDAETGVFIGVSNIDYNLLQRFRHDRGDVLAGTGNALSIVANRVSNTLSLTGPSIVTDTACSSSLVALDTACRHLRDGSCDTAFVGGANILLDPRMFITFSRAHMLSPTGRIRAFDACADGFVRGEGVGLVLLKRLDDALADGNRIFATVEATAINQDGGTGTITAPNPDAQIAMMQSVLARAEIQSDHVAFAEAHGTGTSVGDPIEVNAIGRVFGGSKRDTPVLIGSSKTNLGHLEPAAGIAGLIKSALALSQGVLPPSLGYETPNPRIDFSGLNIEVVTGKCRELPHADHTIGLVNSFGFGGTNACALLKANVRPVCANARASPPPALSTSGIAPPQHARAFPLSAPTEKHLQAFAGELARQLDTGALAGKPLASIANAFGSRRDHFECRAVVVTGTHEGLRDRLDVLSRGKIWPREQKTDPPGIVTGRSGTGGKLAFTMTGQGGQWWAMGRELLLHNEPFRTFFETFDVKFVPLSGWSVIDAMMADEDSSELDDAAITPAVMFAFQCGLADIWRSFGVTPDLVVGHSFGEVTAAYLAGGISLDHVARLVMYRGLIRGDVDRTGTMAAIGLGADDVQALLPTDGSVEIGGYNSPNLVTLTGEEQAIDRIIATLNRDDPDIVTRKLALDFAYHSSWFEPVEDLFKENVGQLQWSPPDIPVISTVTGSENERFDADYWWSNLRYPVRYQDGINRALELGAGTFIELGPTRTLSSMTAGCAAAKGSAVTTISMLQRRWDDFESIATAIGELYCSGYDLDWPTVRGTSHETVKLPNQPWLKEPYWHVPDEAVRTLASGPAHPLLGRRNDEPGESWTQRISLETHAFLSDHRIADQIAYPAACYVETIYEATRRHLSTERVEIRNVKFLSALYVAPGDDIELRTTLHPGQNLIEIHSRQQGATDQWELRACGNVLPYDTQVSTRERRRIGTAIDTSQFYQAISNLGYYYGSHFRHLNEISVREQEAHARLGKPERDELEINGSTLPAPLLDSTFQLMLATSLPDENERGPNELYLPTEIGRITIAGALEANCEVFAHVHQSVHEHLRSCDFDVRFSDGSSCISITGLRARSIQTIPTVATDGPRIYRDELVEWICPETFSEKAGSWLILENQTAKLIWDVADACVVAPSADRGRPTRVRTLGEAAEQWAAVLQAELTAAPNMPGIVYKPDHPSDGIPEASSIAAEITHQTRELLGLGRALQTVADQFTLPRIWVLVRSVQTNGPVPPHGLESLQHASLLGAVRTLQMECAGISYATITVDPFDAPDPAPFANILRSDTLETEFVIANGEVRVPRLSIADDDLTQRVTSARNLPDGTGFTLNAHTGRGFEALRWTTHGNGPPQHGEVQVEITHAGLNFRDIMAVTGVLPRDAETSPAIEKLGLEFAGRVVASGDDTPEFACNDRVFGMARGTLTRRMNLSPGQLFRTPESLTDAEAATLSSAFLTADYALNHVGRLAKGEKLLIHNGSGAVGLAAVSLARALEAEIFVTAGSEAKREYLRQIGVTNVLDSRSLSFSDEILKRTDGYGVDVVLNALPGPYIDKALDCLAPYGRFLEIGKRDVYADRPLGLRSLRANQSFHVIDVAAMLIDRPQVVRQIMGDLLPRFQSGELAVLPHQAFPASRIEEAFRHFAA